MVAVEILTWWYRRGWAQIAKNAEIRLVKVSHLFSVPILIRTWFAPWHRIVTYPGAGIDAQFRAMADNLVSRLVGFTVRTFVLLTAGLMLAACVLFGVVQLMVWPLLPPAVIIGIIKAVIG